MDDFCVVLNQKICKLLSNLIENLIKLELLENKINKINKIGKIKIAKIKEIITKGLKERHLIRINKSK